MCKGCKDEMTNKSALSLRRRTVAQDDNFANMFDQGIIKTLTDPGTPEHIMFKYINDLFNVEPSKLHEATLRNYIQVLNLMRDHPNLKTPQAREEVTMLLQDFGDTLRGSMGSGEGDLMEMEGQSLPEPWENEHDRVMDEFNKLKFPPESDQIQEQVTESPSMTSQEASMLENHSTDEIWDMARKGEPLAQALITKGLVASLKRMQKQALLEWTREAEDLLASRKTPQARKILTLIKRESLAGNLNSIHDFGRVIFNEFPEYRGDASQLRRLYSEFIDQRYLTDPAIPAGEPEDPW